MKTKKIIIMASLLVIVGLLITTFLVFNNDRKANYKIVVSVIEKNSPDRKLKVLKNEKEISFEAIYYLDDVLLCKGQNATINKNDVQAGEELKIKLKNKKIIKASVFKEEES